MVLIIIATTIYLIYVGIDYYRTSLEERFYHNRHDWFKPSGAYGHGLGIIGTLIILLGVSIYIARKRYNFLSRFIRLKYLLEFHIFLCTLGPILVLFHTAFKFGGIVSIAFWSMVAVVISGVIGRFIYIQIPRNIEGRELSLNEVKSLINSLNERINLNVNLSTATNKDQSKTQTSGVNSSDSSYLSTNLSSTRNLTKLKKQLKKTGIAREERSKIVKMIKEEISLSKKITRLQSMQNLFKYWHVAHLPFALIMLIIVVMHVIITLVFGYKWIF